MIVHFTKIFREDAQSAYMHSAVGTLTNKHTFDYVYIIPKMEFLSIVIFNPDNSFLGFHVKSIPAKELMFPDMTSITALILLVQHCFASNAMSQILLMTYTTKLLRNTECK